MTEQAQTNTDSTTKMQASRSIAVSLLPFDVGNTVKRIEKGEVKTDDDDPPSPTLLSFDELVSRS